MAADFYKLADAVETEADFLDFLAALRDDRIDEVEQEKKNPSSPWGPGANGWENGSIEAFIDAAHAWGSASVDGSDLNERPDNPWQRAARIIHAGKFYD